MASKTIDKARLRELMKQEKQKKIDSPFAKYTSTGQLHCALCGKELKSETGWQAHVNGREHKQKVLELKSSLTSNSSEQFLKPLPPSPSQQKGTKRPLDVASNNSSSSSQAVITGQPTYGRTKTTTTATPVTNKNNNALPADFFDSAPTSSIPIKTESIPPTTTRSSITITKSQSLSSPVSSGTTNVESSSALPEGFFDDPHMDARVRKVEYVDKMEVEWDNFTKIMKQESNVSEKMEMIDDKERNVDREIKETTDLITRWKKIEDMHVKKEEHLSKILQNGKRKQEQQVKNTETMDSDNDDGDDEELEKELTNINNWRQKRS